jgi:hypothetical protein
MLAMDENQIVAFSEQATFPYSRDEVEAMRECAPSSLRGVISAAQIFALAVDAGALTPGTAKQNAHKEIADLARWVKKGPKLGALGSQARDHLAHNRLRHPVKRGQRVTAGDLGTPRFQTSIDELMSCLGRFEMIHRHALENPPPAPGRGPKVKAVEEQLILAIREAWLYAEWPEGAPPRGGWPTFRHLCLRPLEERHRLEHVSEKVWEKRLTNAQRNLVGDRK